MQWCISVTKNWENARIELFFSFYRMQKKTLCTSALANFSLKRFLSMQSTAFVLFNIQIWIDVLCADMTKTKTFILCHWHSPLISVYVPRLKVVLGCMSADSCVITTQESALTQPRTTFSKTGKHSVPWEWVCHKRNWIILVTKKQRLNDSI